MHEFFIINVNTGERKTIFGYSVNDAFCRAGLDAEGWATVYEEYVD
jgi:hypothetical protein